MRTLVVGDVHGCAGELSELIGKAACDAVVLVGDLYTKGPDPVGVYRQIRELGARAVLGNHDQRLREVIAGRRPRDVAGARCVDLLDAADPSWRDHLRALPLSLQLATGQRVVHAGLHPSGDLGRTTFEMAISMRRYPGDGEADPWWVDVYDGPPVISGHDARRGLVRRERAGAPWVIGLDTGCVYGGQLSGWVPETDELYQVPAARVYEAITKR